ncbi:MAG TPA: hypothetical protein VGL24_12700 [Chthoniobacterales bacterium]
METLVQRIGDRLKQNKVCRVFFNEIERAWPLSAEERALRDQRIKEIEKFAKERGWSVAVRDSGLSATFSRSGLKPG